MDTDHSQPALTLDQALRETLQRSFTTIQPPASIWLRLKDRIGRSHPKRFGKPTRVLQNDIPGSSHP